MFVIGFLFTKSKYINKNIIICVTIDSYYVRGLVKISGHKKRIHPDNLSPKTSFIICTNPLTTRHSGGIFYVLANIMSIYFDKWVGW